MNGDPNRCEICGRFFEDHYSKCPVAPACPMVYKGKCSVYGYCVNILGDPIYKKNHLTFCVNYAWRISHEVKVNEFYFARNKKRRRDAITRTQKFYERRPRELMEVLK